MLIDACVTALTTSRAAQRNQISDVLSNPAALKISALPNVFAQVLIGNRAAQSQKSSYAPTNLAAPKTSVLTDAPVQDPSLTPAA